MFLLPALQIPDEAVPRDGDAGAEERDPGDRVGDRRGRGHEHPHEERHHEAQEQGPSQPGPALRQGEQHQVVCHKSLTKMLNS